MIRGTHVARTSSAWRSALAFALTYIMVMQLLYLPGYTPAYATELPAGGDAASAQADNAAGASASAADEPSALGTSPGAASGEGAAADTTPAQDASEHTQREGASAESPTDSGTEAEPAASGEADQTGKRATSGETDQADGSTESDEAGKTDEPAAPDQAHTAPDPLDTSDTPAADVLPQLTGGTYDLARVFAPRLAADPAPNQQTTENNTQKYLLGGG